MSNPNGQTDSGLANKKPRPKVSIGIPVRNGQRYLGRALDSLLAQTFTDFEIIICDNDSSDQTETICREYKARDPRVRYFRNGTNLGPAGNHNKCFNISRGQYFRWHAHDDMCAPTYLEKCVEALDSDPTIVIAYPKTRVIDENDQPLNDYTFHPNTDSADAATRFTELVLVNHRKHRACEIFGLMRSSTLAMTPLQGAYARGDSVLLVRLALLGRFVELPDRLFLSRAHGTQSMQTLPTTIKSGRSKLSRLLGTGPLPPPEWWDASRKGKVSFPEWNLFKEYWKSIGRGSGLDGAARIKCYGVMFKWLGFNVPKLARDVIFACESISTTVIERVGTDHHAAGV